MSPVATADEKTSSGPLLAGPDLRTGAPLHPAALPIGSRPRTVGQRAQADVTAGEDLVPEQALQDEEAESGQVPGVRRFPLAPARCRACVSARRKTLREQQQC